MCFFLHFLIFFCYENFSTASKGLGVMGSNLRDFLGGFWGVFGLEAW